MKKSVLLAGLLVGVSQHSSACPWCNKEIMEGIYNSQFYPNLLTILSAFIALGVIVAILTAVTTKKFKTRLAADPGKQLRSPVPLTTASVVMGIGLGGFVDGIFLHQIFQTHEMLSNKIPATDYVGKSINMFWDGIFHLFCLLVVLVGTVLLWKLLFRTDVDRSGKLLTGGLLMGWGLFNLVEGIIDHHLLKLHNVIELSPDPAVGNFIFLGASIILIASGYFLAISRK